MSDWISGADAARLMGRSRSTILRSLTDEVWRADWWGEEGKGWRLRPLSRRRAYDVSRALAEELAARDKPAG